MKESKSLIDGRIVPIFMRLSIMVWVQLWFGCTLSGQPSLLQSGPMVGYSDYHEALLWAQTNQEAWVHFEYWEINNDSIRYRTGGARTQKEAAFTTKQIADSVLPGRKYEYEVFINHVAVKRPYATTFKTQAYWHKQKAPPQDFKVALGSCVYINDDSYDGIGKGPGGEYDIFNSILDKKPEMMLWVGDNVYLREGEWNTTTGIHYRYTHTRSLPEMQPLLASVHHYAIWDDHDFGPNDSDRSFIHKDKTLDAFKQFWGNPSYGLPNEKGIMTMFSWADVDFFLLDNRYHRAPILRKSGDRTMLGQEQLEWLIDALAFSEANFKMIVFGGLVLSTEKGKSQNYVNGYEEEREYLLNKIEEEGLRNVFFLTGDKHFSEASVVTNKRDEQLFEFSFSPLTARTNTRATINDNQVKGSLFQKRNFGLLEFSGPPDDRKLKVSVCDSKGKVHWSRSFESHAE